MAPLLNGLDRASFDLTSAYIPLAHAVHRSPLASSKPGVSLHSCYSAALSLTQLVSVTLKRLGNVALFAGGIARILTGFAWSHATLKPASNSESTAICRVLKPKMDTGGGDATV